MESDSCSIPVILTKPPLRLHLSSPEGCSAAEASFTALFQDLDTRSFNVLKSLHGESPGIPYFLYRMYCLSPRELRFRKGCGDKKS